METLSENEFPAFLKKIKSGFQSYNSEVNWLIFVLILSFSLGGWIEIFGIWSEFPIMVKTLPEGWRLPSIVTMAIQFGQIGL
jgi:hypothetical protein